MPDLIDVAPGTPEWLTARRAGITATDIVTITGLTTWDSAYALYWRKLGIIPEPGDNDRWRLGRFLEPLIGDLWMDAHPGFFSPTVAPHAELWRSGERSWQMATLDGRVCAPGSSDDAVLELKSWADADKARWDDAPPLAVRAQVLWQMDVMQAATGHVGVLFLPSGEFRSYAIEHTGGYDHDECQACGDIAVLRAAGHEFLGRLTDEALGPPSPDGSAATLAALKARYNDPRNDKAAPVLSDLWGAYEYHLDMAAKHKAKAKEGEALIRDEIGDAGVIEVDGQTVARRTRYPVKEHIRKAGWVDKITRIKAKEEDNADLR